MSSNAPDIINTFNKHEIKSLRLRLGWSQADLARRLSCASLEVELWENGAKAPTAHFLNEMFLLGKQADACSHEVHSSPLAEDMCEKRALGQIEFSEIKEEIE